jgi:hypothetical protein
MLARLLLILPIMLPSASGQVPTYSVAGPNDSPSIVILRHELDSGGAAAVTNFWDAVHKSGAPLIEAAPGATGSLWSPFLAR